MIHHRPALTGLTLAAASILAACSQAEPAVSPSAGYTIAEVPLHQISDDLASGRTTSVEITRSYIARIEALDEQLNSVIAVAPDALEQSAASDARRAAGQPLSPLEGIPILLKDNVDAVGMPTTAGSYALESNYPELTPRW